MLHWGEGAYEAHGELCRELDWLEREHPEKSRLIAVARGHVNTILAAGSCASVSFSSIAVSAATTPHPTRPLRRPMRRPMPARPRPTRPHAMPTTLTDPTEAEAVVWTCQIYGLTPKVDPPVVLDPAAQSLLDDAYAAWLTSVRAMADAMLRFGTALVPVNAPPGQP